MAGYLLLYGRSEAVTISRKSEVSPKHTRQSLVVLIQHDFVQFSTINESGIERTYYQCNWKEILGLLRTGKIMQWADQEVSLTAAALVKYIALYGKVKVADLGSVFNTRGTQLAPSSEEMDFDAMLLQLVHRKILRVTSLHESKPAEDFKQSIRDEEMQKFNGLTMPEAKKAKEVEELLNSRLARLEEETNSAEHGLKRKSEAQDNGPSRKRAKTRVDDNPFVDPDVLLKLNHDKFLVHQRNADLVELCTRRLGPTPAAVYNHILRELEPQIFSCRQDTTSLVFTTLKISRAIPEDLDLESVWANAKPSKTNGKSAKVRTKERLDRPVDSDLDSEEEPEADSDDEHFIIEDDPDLASDEDYDPDLGPTANGDRIKFVNMFLDLFAMDSLHFVRKVGSRFMGEWQIDFASLSRVLKQLEIESVIQQKFGDLAPRLLRIVKDKVKIDEKQLSTTALLKRKDIQHVLTSLHEIGVLDLQEVPKRLDRQPNMTIFLWYHNSERAISCLSQNLCKAMARVHQRLTHELQNRKRLLDKSQRTDVRNRESEYLSKGELSELRKIRNVEEKLLTYSSRLAHSYSILVDY